LNNFKDFDFIWTSPPCPSHSRVRVSQKTTENFKFLYPDLKLYEEIIFLENFFEGKYVVENVIPYYDPLITAQQRGRHLYWCNFKLPNSIDREELKGLVGGNTKDEVKKLCKLHDINIDFLKSYKGEQRLDKVIRNLVDYEAGKTIFETALGIIKKSNTKQTSIFDL
jgi:DNA (cytosine-5)-methyltransferase 1